MKSNKRPLLLGGFLALCVIAFLCQWRCGANSSSQVIARKYRIFEGKPQDLQVGWATFRVVDGKVDPSGVGYAIRNTRVHSDSSADLQKAIESATGRKIQIDSFRLMPIGGTGSVKLSEDYKGFASTDRGGDVCHIYNSVCDMVLTKKADGTLSFSGKAKSQVQTAPKPEKIWCDPSNFGASVDVGEPHVIGWIPSYDLDKPTIIQLIFLWPKSENKAAA